MKKTESESSQSRTLAAGCYEKKSSESETHEKRTKKKETYESGPAGMLGDGGSGASSPGRGSNWHQGVPEQIKISVNGVQSRGCPDADRLNADYILTLSRRTPGYCQWELTFPACCGFDKIVLAAVPQTNGRVHLRTFFSGNATAPEWIQELDSIAGTFSLNFDSQAGSNPSAGCLWPDSVEATAFASPAPGSGFYISPEAQYCPGKS